MSRESKRPFSLGSLDSPVGWYLRTWMDYEGISTTELSKLLGVKTPAIAQWLSGERPIPPRHMRALKRAGAIGVEDAVRCSLFLDAAKCPLTKD